MRKSDFKEFCSGAFTEALNQIWELIEHAQTASDVAKLEETCWEKHGKATGRLLLKAGFEAIEDRRKKLKCRFCNRVMRRERREKTYKTLVGKVQVLRWYYYCPRCRKGFYPLDELVSGGGGEISFGLQERIAEAGSDWGFDNASKKLERYSRVSVSGSTVRRHSERIGRELAEVQKHRPLTVEQWPEGGERDVAIDAGKMHTKEKGWRDVKIAVFSGKDKDPRHYSLHCGNYREWGKSLRRSAAAIGLKDYSDLSARADGADWICELTRVNFPGARFLVDFYHTAEHVCDFGKAVHGEGTKESSTANKKMCHMLKHEGPQALLDNVNGLPLRKKHEVKARKELVGYVAKRARHMDYPSYIKEGLDIGSGLVESACKEILNRRVKQGRGWLVENGMAIAHLRAAWISGEWETFWNSRLKAA